jgi:transporter family-2 protein
MSVIDHFGLLGAQQYAITTKRVLGLVIMAVGIYLVLDKTAASTR